MTDLDVTKLVEFTGNEGEDLAIIKCVCGKTFERWGECWGEFSIGVEREHASECPHCHRKLYWRGKITIFEVTNA